jgi:hypothetical protein
MWTQLRTEFEVVLRGFADAVSDAALAVGRVVLALWSFVRPAVMLTFNVIAALILLFEEWGWRPLSNLLARLARYPLWAKAELLIAGLPPYGALVAFAIPSAVLIPAKLAGVYLLTTGHLFTAAVVIFLAKIASTALIARIFLLTKPALMQIGWFARGYEIFVPWKDALFTRIRESWVWRYGRVVKWRVEQQMHRVWVDISPRLETAWLELKPRVARLRLRGAAAWSAVGARIAQFRDPPRPLPPPKR